MSADKILKIKGFTARRPFTRQMNGWLAASDSLSMFMCFHLRFILLSTFRVARAAVCGALAFGGTARAVVLPNPTITAATAASSGGSAVAGIFDNQSESTEYRTNGAGNNTYIEFDFGSEVTVDGFVNVTRNSTSSVVTGSRLIFDTDGTRVSTRPPIPWWVSTPPKPAGWGRASSIGFHLSPHARSAGRSPRIPAVATVVARWR